MAAKSKSIPVSFNLSTLGYTNVLSRKPVSSVSRILTTLSFDTGISIGEIVDNGLDDSTFEPYEFTRSRKPTQEEQEESAYLAFF